MPPNIEDTVPDEEAAFIASAGSTKDFAVSNVAAVEATAREMVAEMGILGSICITRFCQMLKHNHSVVEDVEEVFPNSYSTSELFNTVIKKISSLGYTGDNTLYGQSACPDEINHGKSSICNLFADYHSEVFHLGGLGGVPFNGKTGFAAFSHHVPEDGHLFVLMSSHIGLDGNGHFGKYHRLGQGCASTACGGAIAAFNYVCSDKCLPVMDKDCEDLAQFFIVHKLAEYKDKILLSQTENEKQASIAHHVHDIAKKMLDDIVNVDFGGEHSTLVVLTGVQINMPRPFDDFFQPLSFYIMNKNGETFDIFEDTFGRSTPWKKSY